MARRILMFSGGMDSYILKEIFAFSNSECLFVDMGTDENKLERQFIEQYYPGVEIVSIPLHQWELENKIIPFRNNILALIAAQYGTDIYFAFTAGDTTKDKDYVFKSQMEGIMNYFSQSENKVRYPGPYVIDMPLKEKTKTEIVSGFIQRGFDPSLLLTRSYSCYAGNILACGECRSCLRKFVALTLNDVDCFSFFLKSPLQFLDGFLEESKAKGRGKEVEDITRCIAQLRGDTKDIGVVDIV